MKISTFIKAYKIALSNICNKFYDWKEAYLGYIEFSESNNKVTFIFSNDSSLTPGSIGVSVAVSAEAIENLLGGLDHIALAEGHLPHDAKIHDVGKVLVVLNNLSLRLKDMYPDDWNNIDITSVWFDSDRGLAYFNLDRFKSTVRTDGQLFLFGDTLNDE